jgi:hypothetical protein
MFDSEEFKNLFTSNIEFSLAYVLDNARDAVEDNMTVLGIHPGIGATEEAIHQTLSDLIYSGQIGDALNSIDADFRPDAQNYTVEHQEDLQALQESYGLTIPLSFGYMQQRINFADLLNKIYGLSNPALPSGQANQKQTTTSGIHPLFIIVAAFFIIALIADL